MTPRYTSESKRKARQCKSMARLRSARISREECPQCGQDSARDTLTCASCASKDRLRKVPREVESV